MVERIREGDIPGVQLRVRALVPASAEEAWSWLTEPRRLATWVDARVTAMPDDSGGLILESVTDSGSRRRERLTTVAGAAPRRWVTDLLDLDAGWPVPTRLTFEISLRGEDTEVSILQQGFAHLPLSDCLTIWETYRRRWRAALVRLAEAIDP
jgi:hypothetical protein